MANIGFFKRASHFGIGTQIINIHEGNGSPAAPTGTLQSVLKPIPGASHARDRKKHPPDSACLPGTREGVIQDIICWAEKNTFLNKESHVMWLYGYVGCGKSSIAQAIAEEWDRRKALVASFFFFRGAGDRSRTGKFAATVASQLTCNMPSTAPFVKDALNKHPDILTSYPLSLQLEHLVYEPFKLATKAGGLGIFLFRGPSLIVIDGLDECEDRDQVVSFITHMVSFFKANPRIPLRFLITSRVEEHIRVHLEPPQVTLVNLTDAASLKDIAYVMEMAFKEAVKGSRVIQAYPGEQWPTPEDLRSLVEHTGGSFIFMATIVKFVLMNKQDGSSPIERLPLALNIDPGLDGLYAHTLSLSEQYPHFTETIATIALIKRPLSIRGLAELLEIPNFQVTQVLINLQAIIQVPGDDHTEVVLCHSSLGDFLNTESRSGRFYAHPTHHSRIVEGCFRYNSFVQHVEKDAQLLEYAKTYIPYHWDAFLDISSANSLTGLQANLRCLISMYNWTPAGGEASDRLVSTYFSVRRQLLGSSASSVEVTRISNGVVKSLFAESCYPLPQHSRCLWEKLVYKYSTTIHPELQEQIQQIKPGILSPSQDKFFLNIRLGILSGFEMEGATGATVFSRTHPSIMSAQAYLYTFWVKHVIAAIEHDPDMTSEVLVSRRWRQRQHMPASSEPKLDDDLLANHPDFLDWTRSLSSDVDLALERIQVKVRFPSLLNTSTLTVGGIYSFPKSRLTQSVTGDGYAAAHGTNASPALAWYESF
ncbi:hypothetical protein D9611_002028 [Ephemerocybe angulata]|uniref:Nephrocystin 3-like N-terminal domain-containing protein n=1 Tax=Ephemerocybe angulata TaxID=980116 RepID=A0A8H5CJ04_9AGAR|nr:hypothetical protein D9611_002028 [Tulosesus angulatus]